MWEFHNNINMRKETNKTYTTLPSECVTSAGMPIAVAFSADRMVSEHSSFVRDSCIAKVARLTGEAGVALRTDALLDGAKVGTVVGAPLSTHLENTRVQTVNKQHSVDF